MFLQVFLKIFCRSAKRNLKNEEARLDRLKWKREKLFNKLMDVQINDKEYMKFSGEVEIKWNFENIFSS